MTARVLWLPLFVLVSVAASAIDTGPAFEDPVLQERYQTIIAEVRCLTCQNQSIKDSNAMLAVNLRSEIRDQIAAGASDAEIYAFLTQRYGDFALYNPPMSGQTLVAWLAPLVFALIGLFVVWRVLRRRAALPMDGETT